jgi:2-polyprenyl-3-methyl-5-hydroxy-6-metoxy-1,4-benzoquinol methylase
MDKVNWSINALREKLIAQHEEYHSRGLEHSLFAETDAAFINQWIHHRLIILSMIPEEYRHIGAKVLDVGGGKGRITTLLGELGFECVNIDKMFLDEKVENVSGEPLIPLLQSYCAEKGVKTIGRDVLLEGVPYPDQTFDLTICSEVIEHLPNSPKPMLAEIYRTLLPGGWLILTTPNIVSLQNRWKAVLGQSIHSDFVPFYKMERGYPAGTVYGGHIREYTLAEVEQMLRWEGFKIIKSKTCDFRAKTKFHDLLRSWRHGRIGLKIILKKILPEVGQHIVVLARK